MVKPIKGQYNNTVVNHNLAKVKNRIQNSIFKLNSENYSDGIIGDFRQSNKNGDCYLLASLYSISKTSKGAEILKNNIKKESNGSYIITLPGALAIKNDYEKNNKKCSITGKYTITQSEIRKARKSGKYAKGDIDVLLYELAFSKYRQEVILTNKMNNQNPQYGVAGQYIGNGTYFDPLKGGIGHDAMFVLTGKQSVDYEVSASTVTSVNSESIKDINSRAKKINRKAVERMLNKIANNPKRYSVTFGLKLNNGTGKDGYHALSINRVQSGRVYFVNPWDSKKEFSLSIEEFMNAAYQISIVDMESPSLFDNMIDGACDIYNNFIDSLSNLFKQ